MFLHSIGEFQIIFLDHQPSQKKHSASNLLIRLDLVLGNAQINQGSKRKYFVLGENRFFVNQIQQFVKFSKQQIWKMKVIFGAKLDSLLMLTLLMMVLCGATQIPYTTFVAQLPSLTYELHLNAGDSIKGTCSWTVSADLDVYFYPSGVNLLARANYLRRQFSSNLNPEILPYTVDTAGTYYLRIDLFSNTPTNFKFVIEINGQVVLTNYDTAISVGAGVSIKQFTTENICRAKLYYNGPAFPIAIFAPGTSIFSTPAYVIAAGSTGGFQFNVTTSGMWSAVIQHNISNTQVIIDVLVNITTFTEAECINFCTGKSFSKGLAPGTTNICMCINYFEWNATSERCEVNCPADPYATEGDSGSTSSCVCQPLYYFLDQSTIDCAAIANTTGPETVNTCTCRTQLAFNSQSLSCQLDCSQINNATGPYNVYTEVCTCLPHFHFEVNNDSYSCTINCSEIANGVSLVENTTDQCECNPLFYFVHSQAVCHINCSLITHGVSSVQNTLDQCVCESHYYFVAPELTCYVNCSSIAHAQGPVENTTNECICQQPLFYYVVEDLVCHINCSVIVNGIPVPNTIDQCTCEYLYYYVPADYTCYVNCPLIPHSLGPVSNTTDQCVCEPLFYFVPDALTCQLNCSLIANALDELQNTTDQCICQPTFYFVPSELTCHINCSLIANSKSKKAGTIDQCECTKFFYFNDTSHTCIVDCPNIPYSTGWVPASISACLCEPGFYWNATRVSCLLNCSNIAHCTKYKVPDTIDQCICESHYYFDQPTFECLLNCTSIANAVGPVANSTTQCICKTYFHFNETIPDCVINCSLVPNAKPDYLTNEKCDCNSGYSFNSTTNQCSMVVCGDGVKAGPEECDDGNIWDNDGCSKDCKVQSTSQSGLIIGGSILGGVALIAAVTAGVAFGVGGSGAATGAAAATGANAAHGAHGAHGAKGGNASHSAMHLQRVDDPPFKSIQ